MTKVLVAGCGDLGRSVASHFVALGAQVTGMRRQGIEFPEGVLGITGDLTELNQDAWPDVDLVYLIVTPQGRTEEAYGKAYVGAAEAVAQAYQDREQKPHVIFVSSTSVYGQNQGQLITDDSLAVTAKPTANKLLEAEQALIQALPTTSVRCSGIYGPGRFRLIDGVYEAEPWEENSWTNRIHRDDVVGALCFLGERVAKGQALPETVIATDEQPVSMWEVKLWLASALGVLPSLPSEITFAEYFPTKGKRIVATRLRALGWRPHYSGYVTGYGSVLKRYVSPAERA